MAREDEDVARAWIESLGTETSPAFELWADDARIYNYEEENAPLDLTGAAYEGPDAAQRWWEELSFPFEEMRLELEGPPTAVGDGRVLSVHRFVGRTRHTRLEFESPLWASVVRIAAGRIVEARGFPSPELAREALARRD